MTSALPAALSREALRKIQAGLDALGHAPGPLDGLWGAATRGAVERLLAAKGKPARTTPAQAPPVQAPPAAKAAAPRPSIRQGAAGHPVREIILHCSATRPEWLANRPFSEQVAEIRRWHVHGNGWRDIGYHHLIGRGGEHAIGRPETAIGAHVAGRNTGTIGICLIGGHGSSERDRFTDHFTDAQEQALRTLIAEISSRTAINLVTGHNQYAAKACPGFHVPSWLASTERT
jgi:peptidoglycan hydrolase-like protein with peptidoglycan-binding domain